MLFVHNPSLHALIKEKENFDNSGSSVLGDTNRPDGEMEVWTGEIRPGHDSVKEYHFHLYWMQNNKEQVSSSEVVAADIVSAVKSGRFVVVCPGVTSDVLPGLRGTNRVNPGPRGPHPVASFETWVPRESLAEFLSFIMHRRRGLSVLVHPLGRISYKDHTENAMWLGSPYPINTSVLSKKEGDGSQYPELGLGYSKKE